MATNNVVNNNMTADDFIAIGRVPEFVRSVNSFSGNPTELVDWLADVDSIFRTYNARNATADQINLLQRVIRRKITGEAADILNANNITCDWDEIKTTLVLYYRDKRDVKTLDFEMTTIKKLPNENISTYYSRVNDVLTHIIAQIHTDDKLKLNAAVHITYFRDKALDAFIRGLENPLNILLKSTNPTSLGQAYQFCMDYYNMNFRSAPFRNELGNQPTPKPNEPPKINISNARSGLPPPLPPKYFFKPNQPQPNRFRFMPPPQRTFTFAPPQRPFPFASQQRTYPFAPPQRTFPPPEPMEVDQSLRSRNLNYGNRPPMNMKRPHPPSQQHTNFKRQAYPLEDTYQTFEEQYDYYDYDPYYNYDTGYDSYYNEETQQETETQNILDANVPLSDENSAVQNDSNLASTNFLEWTPEW